MTTNLLNKSIQETRQERQAREWRKFVRDLKKSVADSYHLKAQHDAYYQNVRVVESVM